MYNSTSGFISNESANCTIKFNQQMLDNLKQESKVFHVFPGGRYSGKSWGVAQHLILKARNRRNRTLCTREVQSSIATSSYRILVDTIRRMGLQDSFKITRDAIVARRTGSDFLFMGLQERTIDSVRSTEGITDCWVEEAHSVSENSWQVLIPTIRSNDRQFYITFNPDMEDDPTYQRFVLDPRADVAITHLNWYDNPGINQAMLKEIAFDKKYRPGQFDHIWLGNTRTFTDAQVFKNKFVVQDFALPDDLFNPYRGRQIFWGADWGFAQDPSTLIGCFVLDRCLYVFAECYGIGVELNNLASMYAPEYSRFKNKWPIKADNSRPETISYLNRNIWEVRSHLGEQIKMGLVVEAAEKWGGSVQDGIEFIKQFDKVVIHPACKHTIQEFKFYQYKTDKRTGKILPILKDEHNHCIDAIRYALDDLITANDLSWLNNL